MEFFCIRVTCSLTPVFYFNVNVTSSLYVHANAIRFHTERLINSEIRMGLLCNQMSRSYRNGKRTSDNTHCFYIMYQILDKKLLITAQPNKELVNKYQQIINKFYQKHFFIVSFYYLSVVHAIDAHSI